MGLGTDTISIGVDLGLRHDPTAVAVARIVERPTGATIGSGTSAQPELQTFYDTRWLERVELDTPGQPVTFQDVGMRLAELVRRAHELPPVYDETGELPRTFRSRPMLPREVVVTIDETGLGIGGVEIIARELERAGMPDCHIVPVMITSGLQKKRVSHGGRMGWHVGKSLLVSRLNALFEPPVAIGLPRDHPDAQEIAREIHDFHLRVTPHGNEQFGAPETTGAHDDYVTALGLCCLVNPGDYAVTAGPKLW